MTSVNGFSRVPSPPARITARLDIVDSCLVSSEVVWVEKPRDGKRQPLLQTVLRCKVGQFAQFRAIAAKPKHLAARRPLRVSSDLSATCRRMRRAIR